MNKKLKDFTSHFFIFYKINFVDKCLVSLTIFYLVLPLIIFVFGWIKPIFAVLISGLVFYGAFQTIRKFKFRNYSLNRKSIPLILIIVICLAVWLFLSGIGGIGLQNDDFNARNAIFHDLINHDWPVKYDFSTQPEMENLFSKSGALVYYFLFWLPAALVGKYLGWEIANFFLLIWSFIGLSIVIYLIFRTVDRKKILILIAFIFFSGMDILVARFIDTGGISSTFFQSKGIVGKVFNEVFNGTHLEWWASFMFQYSSFTTQLFYVFNQAIPTWIVTLLIINIIELESIIYIYSLLLLYAPLPFIGLFPYIFIKCLPPKNDLREFFNNFRFEKKKYKIFSKISYLQIISFQNIFVGGSIMLISTLFLFSNAGKHEHGFIWQFYDLNAQLVFIYIFFCLNEFLIFGLMILKNNSEKNTLIVTLVLLSIIPLYKYGTYNDFAMRSSIPPLIILFTLIVKYYYNEISEEKDYRYSLRKALILIFLLIGSTTPIHEFYRSTEAIVASRGASPMTDSWLTLGTSGDYGKMNAISNFVVGNPEEKLFFRVLGK